jgi:hypothetical protein
MWIRPFILALAFLAFDSFGNRCAAQIGASSEPSEPEIKEFKLPSFQFGGSKAPVKKVEKKEPAPSGISTIQLIVILSAVSLLLLAVGIWAVRLLITTSQKCSWDHYLAKKPMRTPPRFAPKYIEVESFPGLNLCGRLYRIFLFKDQIIAIEYGQGRFKKALRFLAGNPPIDIEHARNEAERMAARIAFLNQLDETGILELAQFDTRSVVVPRSKIVFFGTGGKAPWSLFASCSGRLTLQTDRRKHEWTFSDRTAQLYFETVLQDESHDNHNTLTTALRLAQPQYEVVDLVADPSRPAQPRTNRLSV